MRTYFNVVLPMLKPTLISVGILELMWVWNDYLLPYLVLDITKYRTIPIHVQYLKGSYGTVDLGATMASSYGHSAHHHCLPVLPEVHHQGRRCRRGEGIISSN